MIISQDIHNSRLWLRYSLVATERGTRVGEDLTERREGCVRNNLIPALRRGSYKRYVG